MSQGKFYARTVTVAAATAGVPNYVQIEPAVGPGQVLFTGVIWRDAVTNFIPCIESTAGTTHNVTYGGAAATNFAQPMPLTNVNLREIRLGSLGTAGGNFSITGTIV